MVSNPHTIDGASASGGTAEDETALSTERKRGRERLGAWLRGVRRCTHRTATGIVEGRPRLPIQPRVMLPGELTATLSAPAGASETAPLTARVSDRIGQLPAVRRRLLPPTVTILIALVAMTGVAAAQEGGVCGTPAVDLFEWAAQTGAGMLFLGGLLYGGFEHARAGLSRNPEMVSRHRSRGTMAMVAGPIFGLVILFGEQAAAAAGFNVAECANVTPW